MTKLLLCDLDGTVRETASGEQFISHPLDQRIISGADKALAHYHQSGWTIVGITNQGGVEAGHKSPVDCMREQHYTLELCPEITSIIFCLDFKEEMRGTLSRPGVLLLRGIDENELHNSLKGTYRKPNPGMLLWALASFRVEKADCLYVGDAEEDEAAASAANVRFMWAAAWREANFD